MNDQTFHTPSFGDEEFDIPQFNHHLTSHTMDQNQYQMNHLEQQQQQPPPPQYVHPQQQQQQPQWHEMNAGGYGMHQQSPQHSLPTYMQMGGNPGIVQQNNHYHPQQQQQQSQQQQQQQLPQHMSPQVNSNQTAPPTYHTLGQSPHAQHANMGQVQQSQQSQQSNAQMHQQQSNVIVENGIGSEDSDDAIPVS